MPRTNYILIDCENVWESDLARVIGKPVRVFMIIGNRHKNLPTSLFQFAQDHPGQLTVIQTTVEGHNALDLVLTFELSQLVATDPDGYFHIISKDNVFKSVIRHLEGKQTLIARHASLAEIPVHKTTEERVGRLQRELADASKSRPSTRQKLENKISSMFAKSLPSDQITSIISSLEKSGILSFSETGKVIYKADGKITDCISHDFSGSGSLKSA